MPSLGESSYCGTCGKVYRTAAGHNCPGLQSLAFPENESSPPWSLTPRRANPSPSTAKDKDLNATVTRAEDPVLDQPPSPASPPAQPSGGDRELAMIWIMGGRTSADAAAMAGSISGRAARRTAADEIEEEDKRLVRYLEVIQDEVAAERAAAAARLASAMAELEAQDWTPEKARAALSLPEPRKEAAA